MNRQLLQIKRYLEIGPEPGCSPFDKYAFNTFGWQAAYYTIHGKTEQDRAEAVRLRDLASAKSKAFQQHNEEVVREVRV